MGAHRPIFRDYWKIHKNEMEGSAFCDNREWGRQTRLAIRIAARGVEVWILQTPESRTLAFGGILPVMNPRYKQAALVGITVALMIPYLGFVLFFSSRFPSGLSPSWFTNTILVWFTSNFLLGFLIARRMFRNQAVDSEVAQRVRSRSLLRVGYLVIVWCGLFVYGVIGTIQGKYALNRALPAGAFLLFFIGLFGCSLCSSLRKKA